MSEYLAEGHGYRNNSHTLRQTKSRYVHTGGGMVEVATYATIDDVKSVFKSHELEISNDVAERILKKCVGKICESIQYAVDEVLQDAYFKRKEHTNGMLHL